MKKYKYEKYNYNNLINSTNTNLPNYKDSFIKNMELINGVIHITYATSVGEMAINVDVNNLIN